MIQQPKTCGGINSLKMFKRLLEPHIQVVKEKNSTFSYMFCLKCCKLQFCNEILKRG